MRMQLSSIPLAVTIGACMVFSLTACEEGKPTADPGEQDSTHDPKDAGGDERSDAGEPAHEFPGEFTVANGDSEFYVGDGPHRPDTVTVSCADSDGVITATISESQSGNKFTTTQPGSGAGYVGGTLKLGDSGQKVIWEPLDDLDPDTIQKANSHPDARGDAQVFKDEYQEGSPVTWEADGTFELGYGLKQVSAAATYEEQETLNQVEIPGRVDCSGGGAIP